MNLIIGARGRLGRAIALSCHPDLVMTPPRSLYAEWWREDAIDKISQYLGKAIAAPCNIFVASGIINPCLCKEEHYRANYLLHRNIIEGGTKLGFKVVTFGTVMESVVSDQTVNPYLSNKIKLGRFVKSFSEKSNLALHIRLHTLFGGGMPEDFMFLGQIFRSLISKSEFNMTSGTQLREYHHVDDEVLAITKILESNASGCVELNHDAVFTLKDIAHYIFSAFSLSELLKVGKLQLPCDDNFKSVFKRPIVIKDIHFRETLPALVDYLRHCMNQMRRN